MGSECGAKRGREKDTTTPIVDDGAGQPPVSDSLADLPRVHRADPLDWTIGLAKFVAESGPRVSLDVPMRDHTAMRIGGPADALVICETGRDLAQAVSLARAVGIPWLVLGGGCNVLVADSGIRGLVIVCRAAGVVTGGESRSTAAASGADGTAWNETVRAEAGASLAALARDTVARGAAGLEWASGLPGSVGGAVVGNAGAFEGDIAGSLVSATVLAPDGALHERPAEWFRFGYRVSRLKRERTDRHVLVAATFGLKDADAGELDVTFREIVEWRRTRHPAGSTMGSTFKNPPGSHAGCLVEQAGLRGYRIGGAEVSPMHGNFFMNTGGAKADDVKALIDHVRSEVLRQFGIELELEIEFVGHV